MTESVYVVNGMTCGHCVSAVTAEVGQIDGVQKVDVDLAKGTVQVLSDREVSENDIRAAIDEAGYELVS
jgi:copper ion binding protein